VYYNVGTFSLFDNSSFNVSAYKAVTKINDEVHSIRREKRHSRMQGKSFEGGRQYSWQSLRYMTKLKDAEEILLRITSLKKKAACMRSC